MSDQDFVVKTGIKTVVDEATQGDHVVPGSDVGVEQLDMLPLRQVGSHGGAENDVPSSAGAGRSPGRPKGAKNKSTEEWRNYLLSRYSSPLIALAETYSRSIDQLAVELGYINKITGECNATPAQRLEILKVQLQCVKELAPYVHQKQPMAIDAGEGGLMQLVINTGSVTQNQVDDAGAMDLDFIEIESEENQSLSDNENQNYVTCNSVTCSETNENQGLDGKKATDTVSESLNPSDADKGGV